MKKFAALTMAGALLALAGCSGASDENAGGTVKREAGNWRTDVKLVKFDVPGMPDEMREGMKQMMEGASGLDQCFTQEQVDKEDIAAELAKGPGKDGECKWSREEIAGGKVDIAGVCTQNGQDVDMALTGTIEPKKTDVSISTKGKMPNGSDMEMIMQMTSVHTGPCKSDASAQK
ncbi:DUF3617 domain-containing protein [Sphingopyxis sp. MWB1]|uniref:DUF3617 domain-containing protein n=1 Tax=Sphingopyxis sp. MWB1 TaxID=1537715 RepID=UPI00051A1399|nr:DUF3617 domain-containing protein [Sphingopyxis sp. MWB1]